MINTNKKFIYLIKFLFSLALVSGLLIFNNNLKAKAYTSDLGNGSFQNPVLYADYPDVSVIKVDSTYYMLTSSISYTPGLPVLKSEDMVNWEICSYAYDRIDVGMDGIDKTHADAYNLQNGKNVYSKGSWAPSLKYKDGTFYAVFSSLDLGKTFVCTHKEPLDFTSWTFNEIKGLGYAHDADLFFDTDGKVYLVNGGCNILELNSDCKSVKMGGLNKKVFDGGSGHDGNRIIKKNGYYYILSTPPKENVNYYQRIEKAWRSRNLTGPYEQKVILDDGGNHQVCIVDDGEYNWAALFEDKGSVGRIPKISPITWKDDWPIIGVNASMKIPNSYTKPVKSNNVITMKTSDNFNTSGGLSPQWQWNHNPDNSKWNKSDRPGWLRLKTSYSKDLLQARNTLTQRIQGPSSSGFVKMDVSKMKPGQIAGLTAFHAKYGYIGVKNDNGTKKLVQYNVEGREYSINLTSDIIYLKIDADCTRNSADFFYSNNGITWTKFGDRLGMDFYYKLWFIGYRFGLFNYTTGADSSGYVDFDYFKFSPTLVGNGPTTNTDADILDDNTSITPSEPVKPETTPGETKKIADGWYYIKNVNAQKYLQVANNKGAAGSNVELNTFSSSEGQKWYVKNLDNGYITLKSALGNFMIDISGGENKDDANVQIYHGYSGDAQQFMLKSSNTNGAYIIATKCSDLTKVLDDAAFNKEDGANVCQWTYGGKSNQQWIFEAVKDSTSSPVVKPEEKPSTPDTDKPSLDNLKLDYTINNWGESYQVNFKIINNTSSSVNGWTLKIKKSSINIETSWNITVNESEDYYIITPVSWNASITAGSSIEFGIQGNGSIGNTIDYTLD